MEELRELFNEGAISFDDFTAKLSAKGIKLADLSKDGYVDKNKYNKVVNDFAEYKKNNDVSKYADYDTIKAEIETLKSEKIERDYLEKISSAKVDDKFKKFVLSEVKPLVTDKKDFDTCLKEYLETNTQFVGNSQTFSKGSSSLNLQGGDSGTSKENKYMNDLIRGVLK